MFYRVVAALIFPVKTAERGRARQSESALNKDRLNFELHPKFANHIRHELLRQRRDFGTIGAAQIDQHQCLLLIHADPAQDPALPARLFDQPSCCELELAMLLRITDQGRKLL